MLAKEKIPIAITLIIAIVLIGIIGIHSLEYQNLLKTPAPEGFLVAIHGNVTVTGEALNLYNVNKEAFLKTRPFIRVYSSIYNPILLCNSDQLEFDNITWINDTHGEYLINHRFIVPTNVVVTTDCDGCHNEPLSVSRNTDDYRVDIVWDIKKCREERQVFDNSFQEIQRVENSIPNVQEELNSRNFSDDRRLDVQSDITTANNILIYEAKSKNNETLRYLESLRADWFITRAESKIHLYDLEKCINQIVFLLEKYNDSTCYNVDYVINALKESNSTYTSSEWFLSHDDARGYSENQLELLKNEIYSMYNTGSNALERGNGKCIDNVRLANESFEYQNKICEPRKNLISLFNYSSIVFLLAIVLSVGFILGKWSNKGKEMLKKMVKYER